MAFFGKELYEVLYNHRKKINFVESSPSVLFIDARRLREWRVNHKKIPQDAIIYFNFLDTLFLISPRKTRMENKAAREVLT